MSSVADAMSIPMFRFVSTTTGGEVVALPAEMPGAAELALVWSDVAMSCAVADVGLSADGSGASRVADLCARLATHDVAQSAGTSRPWLRTMVLASATVQVRSWRPPTRTEVGMRDERSILRSVLREMPLAVMSAPMEIRLGLGVVIPKSFSRTGEQINHGRRGAWPAMGEMSASVGGLASEGGLARRLERPRAAPPRPARTRPDHRLRWPRRCR